MSNKKGVSFINILLILLIISISGVIYYSIYHRGSESTNFEMVNVESTDEYKVYYYNQISDGAKIMYSTILSNIELFKSSNQEIKFPNDDKIKDKDFQTAWDAIMLDRPEYFFLDARNITLITRKTTFVNLNRIQYSLAPSKKNINGDYSPYFSRVFGSEEEINFATRQIKFEADKIISGTVKYKSRYDKLKYIHDIIIANTDYNQKDDFNNNTIYGLLVKHKCMCQGYAYTMKYICDQIGIPCIVVNGDGINSSNQIEAHAWNYIKMEDGKWYALDATWDDPIIIGNGRIGNDVKYKYFLKGSDTFFKNHTENGDISRTGQSFVYKEISKTDYKI